METLLSYGEDAKRTQLTSGLFYKDRAGRTDSVDLADNAANDGLLKRRALGLQSRTFDMMGHSASDIFFQDRYKINEVGVKIKLTRSIDDGCLMGAMVGKVQTVKASMFVRNMKLMPPCSSLTPRLWNAARQSIPYAACCACPSRFLRIISMSVTRNCFPINCPRAS